MQGSSRLSVVGLAMLDAQSVDYGPNSAWRGCCIQVPGSVLRLGSLLILQVHIAGALEYGPSHAWTRDLW